ncbi:MAG: hypothetical protein KIB49_01145 [Clostridiales bacterium]|nr:hypothetical protein [Clostridiales bacterium]MBS5915398.1 hypothetical protein [Clostridiales bacterium]
MLPIWPLLVIVSANILYNLATKEIPAQAPPFLALSLAYAVAFAVSLSAHFLTHRSDGASLLAGCQQLNGASLVLGLSIVALEGGYIMLYRCGWPMSLGSLTANILLALALLAIGAFFYKESLSLRSAGGIVLCLVGLALIYSKG